MKPTEHDARHALARGLERTRKRADAPVRHRQHDLGLLAYTIGMASIIGIIGGFFGMAIGAVFGLPGVTQLSIWLLALGCAGFIGLVLRSDA